MVIVHARRDRARARDLGLLLSADGLSAVAVPDEAGVAARVAQGEAELVVTDARAVVRRLRAAPASGGDGPEPIAVARFVADRFAAA